LGQASVFFPRLVFIRSEGSKLTKQMWTVESRVGVSQLRWI